MTATATLAGPRERVRNIGISAHIDSGKTTLTERILFYTGRIHAMRDVKGKDGIGAKMDSMDLEREKGITIQSAATYCDWDDHAVHIVDTPGHVDFTVEVERALRVLDGAVLVLCSVGGVQSQSMTVDRQMRRYGVPCVAFVNKCDRPGADPLAVCEQLNEQLGHHAVMIQHPIGLEAGHEGVVDLIARQAYYFEGDCGEVVRVADVPAELAEAVEAQRAKLCEALALVDDEIALSYLEGEDLTPEQIVPVLREATIARRLTPVCLGSAFRNKGVQPLLDAVNSYLPSPVDCRYDALDPADESVKVPLACESEDPLVMLAFKLEDGLYGQLTYCRVYRGTVRKGDFIYNTSTNKKVKVGRLVQMHADEMHDLEEAHAGDVVALFGIDCASGDTFTCGRERLSMTSMHVPEPVVTLAVQPTKRAGQASFSKALNRFGKEDPTFRVSYDAESGQTIIGGMGELHLQVYVERMRREYGVAVDVGAPQVAYREAITTPAPFDYTHKKQTGGSGQYARVIGRLEAIDLDASEGDAAPYEFVSQVVGGAIPKEFLPACDKGFQASLAEGSLIGAPVVGVRAVVEDGNSHSVDSSDKAFQTAARFAFREAYPKATPVILEPIMRVEVEGPDSFSGAILSSLNKRRGMVLSNTTAHGGCTVIANVPLKEMFGYSNDLRSSTQGKASFSMEFAKYAPVPAAVQEELVREAEQRRRAAAN